MCVCRSGESPPETSTAWCQCDGASACLLLSSGRASFDKCSSAPVAFHAQACGGHIDSAAIVLCLRIPSKRCGRGGIAVRIAERQHFDIGVGRLSGGWKPPATSLDQVFPMQCHELASGSGLWTRVLASSYSAPVGLVLPKIGN